MSASVNNLSDLQLLKLFTFCDPADRLKASEVCRQWARVAKMPWLEILHLDISSIPPEAFAAVFELCPNVQSIAGSRHLLLLNCFSKSLRESQLNSIHLHRVRLAEGFDRHSEEQLRSAFHDMLRDLFSNLPEIVELIWHEVICTNLDGLKLEAKTGLLFPVSNCTSLTRLQLTNCDQINGVAFLESLAHMPNLECLALGGKLNSHGVEELWTDEKYENTLVGLKRLRELCFINLRLDFGTAYDFFPLGIYRIKALTSLEVLVLVNDSADAMDDEWFDDMPGFIKYHRRLKILLIAAGPRLTRKFSGYNLVTVDPRLRYPNGFGTEPNAFLNVFVGGGALDDLHFSQSEAAKIWPINEPMPAFLEKPEVAEIFDGVWAAEIIRLAAKQNVPLWKYDETVRDNVVYR